MGNSVRIITKHCKRMVSREQAEAWFNVIPLAAHKNLYIGTIPSPIKGAP
jgi:hypothetical protein